MNIDRNYIAEQLGFSHNDIDMLLTMFQKNANTSLEEMHKMIEKQDMQGIVDTAHAISGSAGTLKLDDIYELAKEIEMAAKTGQSIDYHLSYKRLKTLLDTF
jgi:HPt (histidine-containing phosphotransfer) domain-containing protein